MYELMHGMEGYPVRLLQYALDRAGMEPGAADGIFGRRTSKALLRFQREQGLSADAVAGKLTWAALYPYISGYSLHSVTRGETFDTIAERFGTGVKALQNANPSFSDRPLSAGAILTVPMPFPVVTGSIPCSGFYTEILLKGLTMRYPFLTVYEIGRSVMGQRILAVSIGRGRKQIGYNAAYDAGGWMDAAVLLRFLEEYAAAVATDGVFHGASAMALYDSTTLHMVPLVNPDGVDLVTGALDPMDSYYAQAKAMAAYYPHIPFPTGWRSNILGVDLSLQYPSEWNRARRAGFQQGTDRPGPVGYAGSEPLIVPESRSMARWTGSHDFALTISFDPGYAEWFEETWRRPSFVIDPISGAERQGQQTFTETYETDLPILFRHLSVCP